MVVRVVFVDFLVVVERVGVAVFVDFLVVVVVLVDFLVDVVVLPFFLVVVVDHLVEDLDLLDD